MVVELPEVGNGQLQVEPSLCQAHTGGEAVGCAVTPFATE